MLFKRKEPDYPPVRDALSDLETALIELEEVADIIKRLHYNGERVSPYLHRRVISHVVEVRACFREAWAVA